MHDVTLAADIAGLVDHHLAVGADEVRAGRTGAGMAELILARGILRLHGADGSMMIEKLPGRRPSSVTAEEETRTAVALARELQAHFTSEAQFVIAQVYEDTAARLEGGALDDGYGRS